MASERGMGLAKFQMSESDGLRPAILRVKRSLSLAGKRRSAIAHELGH